MSDPPTINWQPGRPLNKTLLAAIYDQYHELIYRYLYRQVGDIEIARDLSADVFRRLLAAVQEGRTPQDNLKAWLYRTAHNLLVDYYRRQRYRNHLPLPDDLIDIGDDPVLAVEFHISAQQVRLALRRLTSEQRQVVTLKFLEGLSNQEISVIVGKPVGAIKALQHRALEALRRELALEKEVIF